MTDERGLVTPPHPWSEIAQVGPSGSLSVRREGVSGRVLTLLGVSPADAGSNISSVLNHVRAQENRIWRGYSFVDNVRVSIAERIESCTESFFRALDAYEELIISSSLTAERTAELQRESKALSVRQEQSSTIYVSSTNQHIVLPPDSLSFHVRGINRSDFLNPKVFTEFTKDTGNGELTFYPPTDYSHIPQWIALLLSDAGFVPVLSKFQVHQGEAQGFRTHYELRAIPAPYVEEARPK